MQSTLPRWIRVTRLIAGVVFLGLLVIGTITGNRELFKAGWYVLTLGAFLQIYHMFKKT